MILLFMISSKTLCIWNGLYKKKFNSVWFFDGGKLKCQKQRSDQFRSIMSALPETLDWPLASVTVDGSGAIVSEIFWPAHIAFRVWNTARGATFIFRRSTMILRNQEKSNYPAIRVQQGTSLWVQVTLLKNWENIQRVDFKTVKEHVCFLQTTKRLFKAWQKLFCKRI